MIVLDASVLIAHLDSSDSFHSQARRLLDEVGPESLGASSITLAEVFVAPVRLNQLDRVQSAIDALEIRELELGEGCSTRLAELRATTGLKMPDCCVIASSESKEWKVATFDRSLARVADGLGFQVLPSPS